MPWANGRGTSYEVSRGGGEVWDWRVAIAPVVEPGPFSTLAGVDRHLVVLDEAPLALTIDGTTWLARRGEVVRELIRRPRGGAGIAVRASPLTAPWCRRP
ncbi:MAG: hypothetical protein RIR87_1277 [Actinomycetota bacterium]